MSSNVISKSKVVVQDDFFNEIVDGLKKPVEEAIEKKDAKNSRVFLGGKQLMLFKGKVAPLIGKEVENNGIMKSYTAEVQKSYYTMRINEVYAAFQESIGEYKQVEYDTADELEEIEDDKKSFGKFVWEGYKIFRNYRRLKTIYNIIQAMRSQITPKDEKLHWDISDYELETKSGREQAGDDLVVYLNENLIRFVPVFEPLIRKTSEAIWAGAYKTFDKFNRALYWMFVEEIAIQTAIEVVSFFVGIFTLGAGYAAGKVAQLGRIAMFMNKIKKIASVGLGVTKFINTLKKARVIRTLGIKSYKAGKAFRTVRGRQFLGKVDKTLGHVLRNRRSYWEGYKWTARGIAIVDILNVDEDDIDEVQHWAKEKLNPMMNDTYKEYRKFKEDYDTIEEIGNVFNNLGDKMKRSIVDTFTPPANPEKYENIVKIKNLNFDFVAIDNLGKYISQGWSLYDFDWGFGVKEKSEGFWVFGDGYSFNSNNEEIHLRKEDKNHIITPFTLISQTTKEDGTIERKELTIKKHKTQGITSNIRLNSKIGRRGTEVIFGKFGEFLNLRLFYQFRYKGKWYDRFGYENLLRYYYDKSLNLKTSINYRNRGKNDKRVFKVENKGDDITITKISKQNEHNYKLRNEKNELINSIDLSEIIIFKNKIIEDEIAFGKKVDSLIEELQKQMEKQRIDN